jgi:hypothetical protein
MQRRIYAPALFRMGPVGRIDRTGKRDGYYLLDGWNIVNIGNAVNRVNAIMLKKNGKQNCGPSGEQERNSA